MTKINKLVIPVAGLGTRFLPVTKGVPKEMLPIVSKPTIMILLEEAIEAGIEEVLFVINSRKECIKTFFEMEELYEGKVDDIKEITQSIKINYVYQEKPLGSGDAILKAKDFVGNNPFAIIYGDDLIKGKSAIKELIDDYDKYQSNVIGISKVDSKDLSKYGIIEFNENNEINRIIEKPNINEAPSNYAVLGRYIFNPEIFECLEQLKMQSKNEYQLTEAMTMLMKNQKFYGCKFSGKYFDIGSKIGYLKANIEYALDNDELSSELKEYLKNLSI